MCKEGREVINQASSASVKRELRSFTVAEGVLQPQFKNYYFVEGMTFGDWVASVGNTGDYTIQFDSVCKAHHGDNYILIADHDGAFVRSGDMIDDGEIYITKETENPIG